MGYLPGQHVGCQISLLLEELLGVFGTFCHFKTYYFLHDHQLPLPQISDNFGLGMRPCILYGLQLFSGNVSDSIGLLGIHFSDHPSDIVCGPIHSLSGHPYPS